MIPVVSLIYEVISMTLGYFSDAAKVSSLMVATLCKLAYLRVTIISNT